VQREGNVTFDQETHGRLRFERNPLKVVVAQVRFEPVHQLASPEVRAAIQVELADRYPRALQDVQEVTFAITAQGPTPPQVERTAVRFADETEGRIVAVGSEMASFETTHYEGWEEFRDALRGVLEIVGRHGRMGHVTRFGLRYVDELTVDGALTIDDWSDLLSESLIGTPDGLARDPRVLRTLNQATIAIEDDLVNVRQGFTGRSGGEPVESVYVIDTDMATTRPEPWSVDAVMARAERYHVLMTNIFVRSLTPAGIERLGGTPR
jgi:uncharacterized protein (TIGR04255 family)